MKAFNPSKLKHLKIDIHYQKNPKHIFSWIYAHIIRKKNAPFDSRWPNSLLQNCGKNFAGPKKNVQSLITKVYILTIPCLNFNAHKTRMNQIQHF